MIHLKIKSAGNQRNLIKMENPINSSDDVDATYANDIDADFLFKEIFSQLNQGESETIFYFYTLDGYKTEISNDNTDSNVDNINTLETLKTSFNEGNMICIEKFEKALRDENYEYELFYDNAKNITKCKKYKKYFDLVKNSKKMKNLIY